jgi:hypothetical protein
LLCGHAAIGSADEPPGRDSEKEALPTTQPREFAPGVRIDWHTRTVEVDARVVLRTGPLELLACTRGTREHESILVVGGRPTHIFQAMGLVGLQPGSPVRYDEKQQRLLPPSGEALELRVRYLKDGIERTVPVERWLLNVEKRRSPESIPWVFSGSRLLGHSRLGAEEDGTVVCVVDFDTALITVGALHTADNEALWLAANTDEIAPLRTPCTLLIRAEPGKRIEVELAADGSMRLADKPVSIKELIQMLRPKGPNAKQRSLVLRAGPKVSKETVERAVESLVRGGIDREAIVQD